MKKFTWKNITKSNSYVLTQGEYGVESRDHNGDDQLTCEYLIDNTRTSDKEKTSNKASVLKSFNNAVVDNEKYIEVKILNVSRLGYHIYLIDLTIPDEENMDYIDLAYVHKDDLDNYLKRRKGE